MFKMEMLRKIQAHRRKDSMTPDTCNVHGGHLTMFCLSCDVICCLICVDETHHGHNVTDKDTAKENLVVNVSSMVQRIQSVIEPDMKRKMEALREGKRKNKRDFKDLVNTILDRGDDLRSEIDDIINDYVEDCEDMRKRNDEVLTQIIKTYEKSEKEIHGYLSVCLDATTSGQLSKLIEAEKICSECVEQAIPKRPRIKLFLPKFVHGIADNEELKSNVGRLELPRSKKRGESNGKLRPNFQTYSEFTYQAPFQLRYLRASSQSSAWVGCWDDSVNLIDRSGSVFRSVCCGVTVMDVCEGENGCLWLACEDNSVRRTSGDDVIAGMKENPVVKVNGRTLIENKAENTSVVFHTDWTPYSVCMCSVGILYVAMSMCTVYNRYVGRIARYTHDGKIVNTIENDKDGNTVFEKPQRIDVSKHSSFVAVVDFPKSIVVLNQDLSFRFRYTDEKQRFSPCDVSFDADEHLMVCDSGTKCVLLMDISGDGAVPTRVVTGLNDVAPVVISCDITGDVWLGLEDKTVKVMKRNPPS